MPGSPRLPSAGKGNPRETRLRGVRPDQLSRLVFGAPSYVIGDQIFWGQDRLDVVERALA